MKESYRQKVENECASINRLNENQQKLSVYGENEGLTIETKGPRGTFCLAANVKPQEALIILRTLSCYLAAIALPKELPKYGTLGRIGGSL